MSFHLGQKVVCINDVFSADWNIPACASRPVRGHIYTVRAVIGWLFIDGKFGAILLHELRNPVVRWDDGTISEHPFWVGRFRPVITRSTDTGMAILRQILTDHKTPVREKA